jgi:hypothetical protein
MINLDAKLTCPKCGCASHLRAFGNEDVIEMVRIAARFGRAWPWVEEYIHSFQSDHDKPLRPSRIKVILHEILEMIEKPTFRIEGKDHQIRPNAIYQAIHDVAILNKVGFRNHNYLKKVAIGINLKMIQGEEKQQRQRQEDAMRRQGDPQEGLRKLKEIRDSL